MIVQLPCCSNQQLSNWTEDELKKREIIPGTRNLANYPGLLKSRILEGNQQVSFYWISVI